MKFGLSYNTGVYGTSPDLMIAAAGGDPST